MGGRDDRLTLRAISALVQELGSDRLVHDDDERRVCPGALREVPDPLHQVLERPLQYTRSTGEKENSMAKRRVQLYERRDKDWGWRRLSANNNITATSGEGYSTPIGAERAAKRENPGLPVVKKQSKKRG